MEKTILIIGAGPAGLTAAHELQRLAPTLNIVVLEALDDVGGISRTIEYRGYRMDIGGHRFFSKSDWVMDWWRQRMPVASTVNDDGISLIPAEARCLLIRPRLSRIYFLRQFFAYPITLSLDTLRKLGLVRIIKIGLSYVRACCAPRREQNLEDFFINRFGRELYRTFFKDYTEKVWGIACASISPQWGAQRIKGLSITRAVLHAIRKQLFPSDAAVGQKQTETSLIERFLYPKLGPGQMWRVVAEEVTAAGAHIHFGHSVTAIEHANGKVSAVRTRNAAGEEKRWPCDALISSMPVKDLIRDMVPTPPDDVCTVAADLRYRDFITLGMALKRLKPRPGSVPPHHLLPDTWIYVQEPGVKLGRLQIFNNWSPALVADPDTIWLGLEYFCQEGDELWSLSDHDFSALAIRELAEIDLINPDDVVDTHLVRIPKAYPAYFGGYEQFDVVRDYCDSIDNLYLVGRNGMHRYNNQDHSMLTARLAAECIATGNGSKSAIWSVNVEREYHESKS